MGSYQKLASVISCYACHLHTPSSSRSLHGTARPLHGTARHAGCNQRHRHSRFSELFSNGLWCVLTRCVLVTCLSRRVSLIMSQVFLRVFYALHCSVCWQRNVTDLHIWQHEEQGRRSVWGLHARQKIWAFIYITRSESASGSRSGHDLSNTCEWNFIFSTIMSAGFRITPSLWDKIHHFASFPQNGGMFFVFILPYTTHSDHQVSLQQMVLFGQNPGQGTLLRASQFLAGK